MKVGIIDYGAGNIYSLRKCFERNNVEVIVSNKVEELEKTDKIILPGVGQAKSVMEELQKHHLVEFIQETRKWVLGICVGMQILCSYSEEGDVVCCNIFDENNVLKFSNNLKVPHMGWNKVNFDKTQLSKNIKDESYFYFAHSFHTGQSEASCAYTLYGTQMSVLLVRDNYIGCQFHPEKSGDSGEIFIKNFLEL